LCFGQDVVVKSDDGATDAGQLVTRILKSVMDGDTSRPEQEHFLVLPGERPIPFRAHRSVPVESRVLRELQISPAYAGGTAGMDMAVFFTSYIRRVATEYCNVYEMRRPFVGELSDCYGRESQTVDYAKGTVTWRQAAQLACERAALEHPPLLCPSNEAVGALFNLVERSSSGELFYIVALLVAMRAMRSV
jgi:hypothetical protein